MLIVRDNEVGYVVVKQHDHAIISYQIAQQIKNEDFSYQERKQDVLYAIKYHDRAWIPLDQYVRWDEDNRPYDFNSYPMEEKLHAYKQGIKEVEQVNPYSALLCSKHYLSFFEQASIDQVIEQFIDHEQKRCDQLTQYLKFGETEHMVLNHLKLLQFCDDLSLYICINKPGATKKEEWPWFRNGFRQFLPSVNGQITAYWLDESTVQLKPYPFDKAISIILPYYQVTSDQPTVLNAQNYNTKKITLVP
ncbi:DUF3891 family protein [Aquibacillus sediminis]|uniref:DUF3891 family protein n=1 Tax=Aquibacillus sediminis TaxID=2574734 RepID=UPI001486E094|nr:DUF3891 family protein [Aquibacillus sediminis]